MPVYSRLKQDYINFFLQATLPMYLKLASKRGKCIKGLIWPLLEPKTKNCFAQISFDWFIRRMTQVLNFGIYLNFTVAMVTKKPTK